MKGLTPVDVDEGVPEFQRGIVDLLDQINELTRRRRISKRAAVQMLRQIEILIDAFRASRCNFEQAGKLAMKIDGCRKHYITYSAAHRAMDFSTKN